MAKIGKLILEVFPIRRENGQTTTNSSGTRQQKGTRDNDKNKSVGDTQKWQSRPKPGRLLRVGEGGGPVRQLLKIPMPTWARAKCRREANRKGQSIPLSLHLRPRPRRPRLLLPRRSCLVAAPSLRIRPAEVPRAKDP